MFIKASVFERMLKVAWSKYGLHIQRDDVAIAMSGGYWAIWIRYSEIPKEYLGAIVKVTGYIPAEGEQVYCTADGIQQEIGCDSLDLMQRAEASDVQVKATNVIILGGGKYFRFMIGTDETIGTIYEPALQSVDASLVDRGAGHTEVTGPRKKGEQNKFYWFNNVMALSIRTNDPPEELDADVEAIGDYLMSRELEE